MDLTDVLSQFPPHASARDTLFRRLLYSTEQLLKQLQQQQASAPEAGVPFTTAAKLAHVRVMLACCSAPKSLFIDAMAEHRNVCNAPSAIAVHQHTTRPAGCTGTQRRGTCVSL